LLFSPPDAKINNREFVIRVRYDFSVPTAVTAREIWQPAQTGGFAGKSRKDFCY